MTTDPLPRLTKAEQLDVLRTELRDSTTPGVMTDLVSRHLGGKAGRLSEMFTITREEYLAWARTLPLSAFIGVAPDSQDGYYVGRHGGRLRLYYQEREGRQWDKAFESEEAVFEHAIRHHSPYGIYEYLASGD